MGTKRQADLEAALDAADGESQGPLAKILDDILVHKQRIVESCGVMADRSKKMIAKFAALKSCVEGKECSASDTAEEKSAKSNNGVTDEPAPEEPKVATASTAHEGSAST